MADFIRCFKQQATGLTKIGWGLAVGVLLFLPGQNVYQVLQAHPQMPRVRGATMTLPEAVAVPVNNGQKAPYVTARSAIVMDANSGTVMYQKNPDDPLLPASTTKMMTALVALDVYNLDEVLTAKQAGAAVGQSMGLVVGEKITVKNLLYGLLVKSGNDAALALAENYPDGYQAFIDRMNQKARAWHLDQTHYKNVSGVEQSGHVTTVRDLAILTKEAMRQSTLVQLVGTKSITVTDVTGEKTHELLNVNELLGVVPGLRGVKTGWTTQAGECLVTDTIRDNHEVITVVLGSSDRFGESQTLIEWAFGNHEWKSPDEI